MIAMKYLACIFFILSTSQIFSQEKKILLFDPNDISVSQSFQSSFSQLSDDSIFVADTIDENINNFDALFLFLNYSYVLSEIEGNHLIQYTSDNKPVYIYTKMAIDSSSFWNHIGLIDLQYLLISLPVDSVVGIDSSFTEGIDIDTSFMSDGVPWVIGNVDSVLAGVVNGWGNINTTFISGYDTLNVIVDLYNLIYHQEFLGEVIEQFGLNTSPNITITSPNGGEHWLIGFQHDITWTSDKVDSVKIELSLHNGLLWHTITESTASDGIYEWTVQAPQTSWDCRIKITDISNSSITDESDTTFVIDTFPSVEDSTNSFVPAEFSLIQNYPNPFNPITTIKFQIPDQARNDNTAITLKIYDVLGNEIATLMNEEKPAGSYEVEFDGSSLPSGIYFYQIKAGSFVDTKKMVLIK
jgi:hypothetical protein